MAMDGLLAMRHLWSLSLAEWLRRHMIMKVIYLAGDYINPVLETPVLKSQNYMLAGEDKLGKSTEASLRHYEEESVETQDKIFQLETYIAELEQWIQEVKDQRNMAFVASRHSLKMMR